MITVDDALAALFKLVSPLDTEHVPLIHAAGRSLSQDVAAIRDQPPFAASAMDGYAVAGDAAKVGAQFTVVGESAAGHGYPDTVSAGTCVRIFTGAPLPDATDRVVIQEDVTRKGDTITLNGPLDRGSHVRPKGADFTKGQVFAAPKVLQPSDIALLAAMNITRVPVTRKPVVAIIATGDELVQPGESPNPDQIIASNSYGLAAMLTAAGAKTRLLPIARDNHTSLALAFDLAADADLIVTIGGASVGDHDLVGAAAADKGLEHAFYKIAMRPGKPLMAGRMGTAVMVGLPGNPVSAMVCGHVFLRPVIAAMLGHPAAPLPRTQMPLANALPANGPREHYMRAQITGDAVHVFERQDSALLTVLSQADALVIRPVSDGPRQAGDMVNILRL